jgi:hypothetical protein
MIYELSLLTQGGHIVDELRRHGISYLLTSERSIRMAANRVPMLADTLTRELADRDIEVLFSKNGWVLYSLGQITGEQQERRPG